MTPYLRNDELHMAFNFTLLFQDWNEQGIRKAIDTSLTALAEVSAPPTWVLENHDVTRLPTRYGGGNEGLRRARAAALLLLALPGPVYLYQGQELGLEEVDLPDEARQDPIFYRTKGERIGRDGCRVPLPWKNGPPGFGFTADAPWLPIPASWKTKTVERQRADNGSMLTLYRSALDLRAQLRGDLTWEPSPTGTLVFARGGIVCAVNIDGKPLALDREVLLASEPLDTVLRPGAAAWLR
jgi:alpha-glucosidase